MTEQNTLSEALSFLTPKNILIPHLVENWINNDIRIEPIPY